MRNRADGLWEVEVPGFACLNPRPARLRAETPGRSPRGGWITISVHSAASDVLPRGGYEGRLEPAEKDNPHGAGRGPEFYGTVSLPFEAGDNWRIAVKIVDDRGIESLKTVPLESWP